MLQLCLYSTCEKRCKNAFLHSKQSYDDCAFCFALYFTLQNALAAQLCCCVFSFFTCLLVRFWNILWYWTFWNILLCKNRFLHQMHFCQQNVSLASNTFLHWRTGRYKKQNKMFTRIAYGKWVAFCDAKWPCKNTFLHQANRFHLHLNHLNFIKMFKSKFLLAFCFFLIGIHFAEHFALQNAPRVAKCTKTNVCY